jgi:hypothetical protein
MSINQKETSMKPIPLEALERLLGPAPGTKPRESSNESS